MTIEKLKVKWANQIHQVTGPFTPEDIRRLVSICQDAFNEGREAGLNEASQDNLLNKENSNEPTI